MTTHTLKIDAHPYVDLLSGAKTCEIRNDDRGFEIGDKVVLVGTDGGAIERTISHIQRGYGLPDCRCVLSYAPVAAPSPVPELVRYRMEGCENTYYENGHLQHDGIYVDEVEDATGLYVLASEAERIIADQAKEAERRDATIKDLQTRNDMLLERWQEQGETIEVAEGKLAACEKQVPVALRYRFITTASPQRDWSDWFIVDDSCSIPHRDPKDQEVQPLYAHPVAYREAETIERCAMVLDMMHNNLANNTDYDDRRAILVIAAKNLRALSGKESA